MDAPPILASSIMAGDLIWMDSSPTPEKFTIFLMGKPDYNKSSMSQKEWLKLHLQENGSQDLDEKMIEKMAAFKLTYPLTVSDLRHHINNFLGLARVVFYPTSAISSSLCTWVEHVDDNEILYEDKFQADKMFGLKICLTIDRGIQLFLQSCLNAKEIENVNFKYLDFKFDTESIERGRFFCNAPAPLMELFSNPAENEPGQEGRQSKQRKRNALSGTDGDDNKKSDLTKNDNIKEE